MHYIKILIFKVNLAKEKFLKKSYGGKTLGGGGQICPPPRPTRVNKCINICIDTNIDIDIDIDNFNTDASTVNSVHACFLRFMEISF